MAWLTHPPWTLHPAWPQPLSLDLGPHLGYVPASVLGPPRQDIQGSVVSSSPAPWFDFLLLTLQSQVSVGAASVGRRNRAHLGSNPVTAGVEHSAHALRGPPLTQDVRRTQTCQRCRIDSLLDHQYSLLVQDSCRTGLWAFFLCAGWILGTLMNFFGHFDTHTHTVYSWLVLLFCPFQEIA